MASNFVDTKNKKFPLKKEKKEKKKELLILFSGTNYPTANLYFHCVWRIQLRIMEMKDDDEIIRDMAKEMRIKFDKY